MKKIAIVFLFFLTLCQDAFGQTPEPVFNLDTGIIVGGAAFVKFAGRNANKIKGLQVINERLHASFAWDTISKTLWQYNDSLPIGKRWVKTQFVKYSNGSPTARDTAFKFVVDTTNRQLYVCNKNGCILQAGGGSVAVGDSTKISLLYNGANIVKGVIKPHSLDSNDIGKIGLQNIANKDSLIDRQSVINNTALFRTFNDPKKEAIYFVENNKQGWFYKISSGDVDSAIIFQDATGQKWKRQDANFFIRPEWFGAIVNDTIEDDIGIQKAINYASFQNVTTVLFKEGTYLIGNTIVPKSKITLKSESNQSILKLNNQLGISCIRSNTHIDSFVIDNLSFDGGINYPVSSQVSPSSITDQYGIFLIDCSNIEVKNCNFSMFSRSSITIASSSLDCKGFRILNNTFRKGGYKSKVIGFLKAGIGKLSDIEIVGNLLDTNGVQFHYDASDDAYVASQDGIDVDESENVLISSNTVNSCAGNAIRIEQSKYVIVSNNKIKDAGQGGITFYLQSNNGICTGNTIIGWGKIPPSNSIRKYLGVYYIAKEYISATPANPSIDARFIIYPYALLGVDTNTIRGYVSGVPIYPHRGYAAISVTHQSKGISIIGNTIEGNSAKTNEKFNYACDFGYTPVHAVNGGVDSSGTDCAVLGNKFSNTLYYDVYQPKFMNPVSNNAILGGKVSYSLISGTTYFIENVLPSANIQHAIQTTALNITNLQSGSISDSLVTVDNSGSLRKLKLFDVGSNMFTANNGLTKALNNISWGGTLLSPTTITQAGNNIKFAGAQTIIQGTDVGSTDAIIINNSAGTKTFSVSNNGRVNIDGSQILSSSDASIMLRSNGTGALTIQSSAAYYTLLNPNSGNIGIGSSTIPSNKLTITGGNPIKAMGFVNSNSPDSILTIRTGLNGVIETTKLSTAISKVFQDSCVSGTAVLTAVNAASSAGVTVSFGRSIQTPQIHLTPTSSNSLNAVTAYASSITATGFIANAYNLGGASVDVNIYYRVCPNNGQGY